MTETIQAPEATAALQGFDEFVQATMGDWTVPGVAIAVVKDGSVLLSQGFGLRDVARHLAVTPQTLFAIGSASKAFTTMALAMLADEGKVDWDTPVRTYLPAFKLYDAVATERMTPRDLVTHRSGLPRHDLMWYNSSFARHELFERLQYLAPNKDFRAVWQYQNLMYMTAGYLVEQLTGQCWEEFVAQRIFQPLGMQGSNFSVEESQRAADASLPYKEDDGQAKEMDFRNIDTVGPAGSINSTIVDMTQWLLLHLNKGRHGDVPLISAGQIAQLHSPHMVIEQPSKYKELPHASYGLGWFVEPYRGYDMIHHGGNIDGFSALVSFLPQEGLGVVVLTNRNSNPVPSILSYNVYDRLLGLEQAPWNDRFKQDDAAVKEAAEKGKQKSAATAVPGTHPSHALESYTGDFGHPGYGTLSIALDGEQLAATYNGLTFPLTHYHYDVFELNFELFEMRMKARFSTNVQGDIEAVAVPLEPTVPEIVFTRLPRRELMDRRVLEQFTGEYEIMGAPLIVSLKGEDTLIVSIPGLPDVELAPYKEAVFTVKGLSGFSVEFERDAAGAVTAAIVTQPNGVFTAPRR